MRWLYRVFASFFFFGFKGGATVAQQRVLSPEEAWKVIEAEDPLLLDVRSQEECAGGVLPGAITIPHTEVVGRVAELGADKRRPVAIYCAVGGRAGIVKKELEELGFNTVHNIGGYSDLAEYSDRS